MKNYRDEESSTLLFIKNKKKESKNFPNLQGFASEKMNMLQRILHLYPEIFLVMYLILILPNYYQSRTLWKKM